MIWLGHFWYYWYQREHYAAGGNLPFFRAWMLANDRTASDRMGPCPAWGGERDDY